MRVLFTAQGAYGHVLPLMGVARALADDGHDVVVATAVDFCDVVASRGLSAHPAGMNDDAVVAESRRKWPDTVSQQPAAWTTRMFCEIAAPAMAADVMRVIDSWRPDIVVSEEGEYGGPVAAAAAGVPWVTHGWGSPLRSPEALIELGHLLAPLWESAGLGAPVGDALYGGAILDPCPPSLYIDPPPARRRRPMRPSTGTISRPAFPRATNRPHAYVGFGTVPLFRDSPEIIQGAVEALLAHGFDVTLTTSDDRLASELGSGDRFHVNIQRWVELAQLLPGCDLVVCHGGAGTVLEALAAGVPLLLLPRGAPSQLRMSAACEARGVGRAVTWNGTNGDELGAAVADILSSDRFSAAAAAVAREIANMPGPSTAAAILAGVISSVA